MDLKTQPRHRLFRPHVKQTATYFDCLPRCHNAPHWTAAELVVGASSTVRDHGLALILPVARFPFFVIFFALFSFFSL
jgi:hypothetical protein